MGEISVIGNPPTGRRHTRQREAVLRAVLELGSHPDVKAVYERVRQELPTISLATVYRNLDVLSRVGVLNEVHVDNQVRYDENLDHHGHLVCRTCGTITDVDIHGIEARILREFGVTGYRGLSVNLEIHGTCPTCEPHSVQA